MLSHRCRQCLLQLAGFKDEYFDNDINAIRIYAGTMVNGILKMMKEYVAFDWKDTRCLTFNSLLSIGNDPESMSEHGPHLLGTIQMVRRLLENVSLPALSATLEFFEFLNDFGKLTVACLRATTADVDEGWIGEASDECLATWVTLGKMILVFEDGQWLWHEDSAVAEIIQPTDGRSADPTAGLSKESIDNLGLFVKTVAMQIVEVYIDAKLEQTKQGLAEEDDDEVNNGFKDWVSA